MCVRIIYNGIILIIVMVQIWTWLVLWGLNSITPQKVHCYISATDIASTTYKPMVNLHIFKFSFPQQPLIRSKQHLFQLCLWLCCLALKPTFQNYIRHFNVLSITKRNVNDSKIYITVFPPSPPPPPTTMAFPEPKIA